MRLTPLFLIALCGPVTAHDRFSHEGQPATGKLELLPTGTLRLTLKDPSTNGSRTYERTKPGPTVAGRWTTDPNSTESAKGIRITLGEGAKIRITWWRHVIINPKLLWYQESAWAKGTRAADGTLALQYEAPPSLRLPAFPARLAFERLPGKLRFTPTTPPDTVWSGLVLHAARRNKGGQQRFFSEVRSKDDPVSLIRGAQVALWSNGRAPVMRYEYRFKRSTPAGPLYIRRDRTETGLVQGNAIVFRVPRSKAWPGFCAPCEKKGAYTEDVGTCSSPRVKGKPPAGCTRDTASGEFSLCTTCAKRLDRCPRCQLPLAGPRPKKKG